MRRKYIVYLIVGAIFLTLLLSHRIVLTGAGAYLKLGCESPPASDVIIVLGGEGNGERTRKGAALYREGVAPAVMLSDGTKMSWRTTAIGEMYDLAVLEGVPPNAIVREDRSRSTQENAVYTKELMQELDYDSAVVVTSDWHAKRSRFIFERVYRGSGIELSYCGTPDDRSDFDAWWKDGEKQQVVLTEWAKTLVYWVRYSI